MDFNFQSNDPNRYNGVDYSCRNPGMAMATASLLLGLASFFTIMTVILPFICGGLAILFALLSKGYGKKLLTQAKIGIICGVWYLLRGYDDGRDRSVPAVNTAFPLLLPLPAGTWSITDF